MDITLSNGQMTAVINSYGAELKSLRDQDGNEYIWDGSDASYWNRSAPFLFPTVGNLRNGKVLIKGEWYEMKQHGFCRDMEWTVADQTPFSVLFTLTDTPESRARYPYAFHLGLRYTLTGRTIRMDFTVDNVADEEMLYCFGPHPAIRVPFTNCPDSSFEDYTVCFNRPEAGSNPIYDKEAGAIDLNNRANFMTTQQTIDLRYDVFEKIDTIIFDKVNSDAVTLRDNRTGKELEVRYHDFDMIAFWTPKRGAPFLCVEPWQGCAVTCDADDRFESKLGVQRLAPYTGKTFTLEIEPKA